MTERLSTLLHEEAERLEIPAPRATDALVRGRGIRRRRRLLTGTAALALVTVLAGGTALVVQDDSNDQGIAHVVDDPAYDKWGAWSDGEAVYVGDERIEIPELVKGIYYTSEGALVRHGESLASDGGGPSRFTLVRPDGEKVPVPVEIGEVVPATTPDSELLVYSEPNGDAFDLVAYDLAAGEERSRRTIEGSMGEWGWRAPAMSLVGDDAYALMDGGYLSWDIESGEVGPASEEDATREVRAGRSVTVEDGRWIVRSFPEGSEIASGTVEADDAWAELSLDGRAVMVTIQSPEDFLLRMTVFDVETGRELDTPKDATDWTWSPGGRLIARIFENRRSTGMQSCDLRAGTCETSDWVPGGGDVRLGGQIFES